jgi:mRNA interferase HigB
LMNVFNREIVLKFQTKYPNSRKPLAEWVNKTMAAKWSTFADIKKTFNSVDYAAPYCIFDVGGNNYRIIAIVSLIEQTVIIDQVLTHSKYDKWRP